MDFSNIPRELHEEGTGGGLQVRSLRKMFSEHERGREGRSDMNISHKHESHVCKNT